MNKIIFWKRANCQACQLMDELTRSLMNKYGSRIVEERIVGIDAKAKDANDFGVFEVPTLQIVIDNNIVKSYSFAQLQTSRIFQTITRDFDEATKEPAPTKNPPIVTTTNTGSGISTPVKVGLGLFAAWVVGQVVKNNQA